MGVSKGAATWKLPSPANIHLEYFGGVGWRWGEGIVQWLF